MSCALIFRPGRALFQLGIQSKTLSRVVCQSPLAGSRELHSSSIVMKVKKNEKNKKKPSQVLHATSASASENPIVQSALKDMNNVEGILREELAKHFSLQVDLRVYEDIIVKMEKGDEHKMSLLGRVSLKTPQMVMINFADNPNAIKWAKLAIQKSILNVNPQHQGVVLYLPTPRMTRERREQLASDAKGKMFNQYKKALNEIYSKWDKKGQQLPKADEAKDTRQRLLELKKAMETRGESLIDQKRAELLKEVV